MQILGVGTPILGKQVCVGGWRWYRWIGRWSSCRLSIVTEAVWPQFAMQVFGGVVSIRVYPRLGEMGGRRGSELVPQCSGLATIRLFRQFFFGKTYRLATIHTLQTDDRWQTDTTSYHKARPSVVYGRLKINITIQDTIGPTYCKKTYKFVKLKKTVPVSVKGSNLWTCICSGGRTCSEHVASAAKGMERDQ